MDEAERKRLTPRVKFALRAEDFEIIDAVDVLWCGWEGDNTAVLVSRGDGSRHWVVLDRVHVHRGEVPNMLRERIKAYEDAIAVTKAILTLAGEQTVRDEDDEDE